MTAADLQGVEYPRVQYNSAGEARRVETVVQAVSLGDDWQYKPDGSPIVARPAINLVKPKQARG